MTPTRRSLQALFSVLVAILLLMPSSTFARRSNIPTALGVEVTAYGGSSGTVTSDPAGINCHAAGGYDTEVCIMFLYAEDTDPSTVTLTATADPGSSFMGWGLDCKGAGTAPTCTLTVGSFNKYARASFNITRVSLEILDGVDFESGSSLTTDPGILANGGHPVLGAVTDGVTKLLLRLNVDQPGSVQLSLQGTGVKEQDGILRSIDGAQAGDTITVNTVATVFGQKAFAIYESPDRFVRAGFGDEGAVERPLNMNVTFTPASSGSPSSLPSTIKLVRPPIVMIHGLWSSESEWDKFQSNLQATLPGVRMFRADYRTHNGSYFFVNRLVPSSEMRYARMKLRSAGIAMIQADVFGHSMGGLLSRIWAGDDSYKRGENYNKGDIHKLVTIDSPHFGSSLANSLIVWLEALKLRAPVTHALLLEVAKKFEHPLDQGAITDLMTNSAATARMNNTVTDLPSHAIIGEVPNGDLSLLPGRTGGFFKILARFGFDTVPDNIPGASDLVVSVPSQAGGLIVPASSTLNHHHLAATQSPDVANHAVHLLNAASDTALFRQGWPVGTVPQSLLGFQSTVQRETATSSTPEAGGVRIVAPPNGSTFAPGQMVTVTVQPTNGFPLDWVLLINPGLVQELTAPPFTFDFTIPNNTVGPLTILAVGGDTAGAFLTSDEITVNVQPSATLQSSSVSRDEFYFFGIGFQQQIVATGMYSDGIERDITRVEAGTTYLSSNPDVVRVDPNGLMTATGSGVATVTVSNSGAFATTVAVTVEQLVAPLTAAVLLNNSAFHTGQTITYQATLTPGPTPTQVDIYLGVLLPDGVTFLSFVPGPGGTIALAFDVVPVPFATNVTLTPTVIPFSYRFDGTEPVGTYYTYAGLVAAGTDPLQAANRLSLAVQPFQFTP